MKYPMKRKVRAQLAKMYFELAGQWRTRHRPLLACSHLDTVLPGLDARLVDLAANQAMSLLESKKKIDIIDLRLPWRKLYAVLEKELFPKQRKTGITNVATTLLNLTEFSQRFFPPHETPEMLRTFLPRLSASLNSILATQAFMVHFLPLTHPQQYLPAVFELWSAFNSSIWDEQWLDFVERLSYKHLDPDQSDPDLIEAIKDLGEDGTIDFGSSQSGSKDDGDTEMSDDTPADAPKRRPRSIHKLEWKGIRRDVGIFTDDQWAFIITKCLRTFGASRF